MLSKLKVRGLEGLSLCMANSLSHCVSGGISVSTIGWRSGKDIEANGDSHTRAVLDRERSDRDG